MPRPRKPIEKAKIDGSYYREVGRYQHRYQPKVGELGPPPPGLKPAEKLAWEAFAVELPWLRSADRPLLVGACKLRAQVESGRGVGLKTINAYRQMLSSLGATPVDRARVPDPDPDQADLFESAIEKRFFGGDRPN